MFIRSLFGLPPASEEELPKVKQPARRVYWSLWLAALLLIVTFILFIYFILDTGQQIRSQDSHFFVSPELFRLSKNQRWAPNSQFGSPVLLLLRVQFTSTLILKGNPIVGGSFSLLSSALRCEHFAPVGARWHHKLCVVSSIAADVRICHDQPWTPEGDTQRLSHDFYLQFTSGLQQTDEL